MAGEARVISYLRGKRACRLQMASRAIFFQHRVRFAHAAAGIDAMIAGKAAPRNPHQCEQRQQEAQPEFRALQQRRPLEIVEVDALREFFCGACPCHVFPCPPEITNNCIFFVGAQHAAPLQARSIYSPPKCREDTQSVAKRHHRVNGAEQDQCERKRDVQQQPPVQPVMKAFLAGKLPRFVANVLEVRKRNVRRGRQQRA